MAAESDMDFCFENDPCNGSPIIGSLRFVEGMKKEWQIKARRTTRLSIRQAKSLGDMSGSWILRSLA